LLRANKIPAKSVCGIVVDSQSENPLHAWTEVYLRKQGWVRFDPTFRCPITKVENHYEMAIQNRYIDLAEGRNEKELQWHPLHSEYKFDSYGAYVKRKAFFDVHSY
jgi:transglutaminase-like putative cysteine protease